ncbi:MAG: carboxypeptidase regulatory-like domain-containing protein [Balneolales bacterium]|nr:carboxypeptidase regulatory-like domain-containing protein [Balneolales bacterium]
MKLFSTFIFVFISVSAFGQTLILQPAESRDTDGEFSTKLLLKKDEIFRITWTGIDGNALNLDGRNAKLVIGRSANIYNTLELDVSGTNSEFIPDNIGLDAGRYFARITNSSERITADIQEDFETNPGDILYSNEILLLIEAEEAPTIIEPRGVITNPTPIFQWTAVSGVPSYWLILSSTPFDIIEDENGDISIEGATIVWQYITKNTTAEYGAINELSPFTEDAPPLNPNQEYSYTVLNVYQENNPAFTSPVFGGIVPFTYSDPNAVPRTDLISPESDETFFSEPTIEFRWEDVPEASNYTVNLLQIIQQQGVDVTVPIWVSTTTNTVIEYPAITSLKSGRYQWNVTTNNATGGGSTSSNRFFNYIIETGELAARIRSSVDNSVILGVELQARAISGGVTPVLPFFVQNSTHVDSLVAGRYELTAVKDGYETGTAQAVINDDQRTSVTINLVPFPSSIQGIVEDENGDKIDDSEVLLTNLSSGEEKIAVTNSNGEFSVSLEQGSYEIDISKSGYISPSTEIVTVDLNEQKNIAIPFVLTNDQATVSGFVFNEDGNAVQQADVTISNAARSYTAKTNGSGAYQFTVGSGDWTIAVEKTGFIKPADIDVSLSTGDIQQNVDFVLTGNANQITGFVRERIFNEDGSTGTTTFSDILVTAIPKVGTPVTARSGLNGQYTLSLKSGSYTIQATEKNYTSDKDRELFIGIAVGETISGIDFELTPNPSSISGSILLPNGNGIDDATVSIPNVGTTQTSASGYFSMSVPSGTHTVSVVKPGLVSPDPKTVTVNVGQNLTGVDFEMIPNAGSISGTVNSGGEVLSNVTLTAINTASGSRNQVLNELDGAYSFNLQSGNWYIKAEKTGFIPDSTALLNVGAGQQLVNQNFTLQENLTTLRGTITDGVNPVGNVDVIVTKIGDEDFNQTTITQVNGTYALALPSDESYQVLASKNGYRNSSDKTDGLIAGSTEVVDFSLTANPSSVSGTTNTTGGGILSDVKIVAIDTSDRRVDSTNTDNDGTYVLGLDPGTYILEATRPGYSPSSTNTTLSIGQNISGISFNLAENFVFINGTIVTESDTGIENVFVNLSRIGGGGASAVTNQDGTFTISGLTGGVYSIELSKAGFISEVVNEEADDGDFLTINTVLEQKNGGMSGVITDENGLSVSEATVTATSSEGINYIAISDANGVYNLTSLEISDYQVNASKTGYTSGNATLTSITDGDLEKTGINVNNLIPNNGVLSGFITDENSNTAIKDVQISATGERGAGFALTSASGEFSITNLVPDSYTLISSKQGYKSDTVLVDIDPGSPVETVNRTLLPNNGTITGIVADPNGTPLPFRVTLIASSNSNSYIVQSNDQGEFIFEGVETGVTYTITTDIYREGYKNVEVLVTVPAGEPQTVLEEAITVIVEQAEISGSTGVAESSVQLLDANTSEIIRLISSNSNGEYSFDFLPEGSYRVTAQLPGYTFSPDTSDIITVSFDGSRTQNFTSIQNIGTLSVEVIDELNAGVPNVDITIISADTSIILNKKTSANGLAIFNDIQATTYYVVRPSKEGFTASPESREIELSSGDSISTRFSLTANNSMLSGIVNSLNGTTEIPENAVDVRAIFSTTGQAFNTLTNSSGEYSFESLAPGSYSIIASKSGFVNDTVSVDLEPGESLTADNLLLGSAAINIQGTVRFKGAPAEGVEVSALSTSSFDTETNRNGIFRFNDVPVKTGSTDTTLYQVKVTSGVFSKNYLIEAVSSQIGTTIVVPVTNLPSGQINLTVTDGVDPLDGAEVIFGISGGESETIITGEDGSYSSSENLREGSYVASVSKQGYLFPQNTITIDLPSDTTILDTDILLPYVQVEVSEILANAETKVAVVNRPGFDNTGATGTLFYKKNSDAVFSELGMSQIGDTLQAFIPALNSTEEISFYTIIDDSLLNNRFISSQATIIPLASGILSNILITPNVNRQNLRVGDSFNLTLTARDGISESLEDEFTGENPQGVISWEVANEMSGIELSNQNGTSILLRAIEEGSYTVRVSANLGGTTLSTNLEIDVSNIPLREIIVSAPGKQLNNSEEHLFNYSAIDTSGNAVFLGDGLSWSVNPPTSATIDSRGLLTPSNSSVFGSFTVSIFDSLSGLTGTSELIELVARIQPDEQYRLINGNGLELELPIGSVDIPSQVSLNETVPPSTKKFIFAQGSDESYTVGDRIYVLSFSGGDLQNEALLSLPVDTTISELNTGQREIARFNFTTLQWQILNQVSGKTSRAFSEGTVAIENLGQFAVMAANEPLGLRYPAVLPSPFSPDIAPVKIGYWLDTAFPPAKVSIKIYNIRGELVRTLLEDDLQQPGRYGSASGEKEITWDGLTNDGRMARNGRYVIQIKAEDQQREDVKLLQVVLIK